MHQLYDLGYQNIKSPEDLLTFAEKIDAVVVDIRFSPKSRDLRWAGANLQKSFGPRYIHLKELGNEDYKGSTIRLANKEVGLSILKTVLEIKPAILLCACWNRKTCHRKTVARLAELMWKIQVIPLEPSDIRPSEEQEISEPEQPSLKQGGLF